VPHVVRSSQAQDGVTAELSHTWYDHALARYVSRLR
jgi:GntR family transcriptional regulator